MLPTSQRTAAFSLRVLVLGVLASVATTGCDIVTADLRHAATSEWRKSYTLEIKELGPVTAVIATGGLAPVVIDECETITHHEPMITLVGLRLVYERNT